MEERDDDQAAAYEPSRRGNEPFLAQEAGSLPLSGAVDGGARPSSSDDAVNDGRTVQQALLLIAPIKPRDDAMVALERVLQVIAADVEGNPLVPFLRLRTVHFARILIQPESAGFPAKLLLATDFDGTLSEHLREWIAVASAGLDALFQHCEGWPGLAERDRHARYLAFADFVARNSVPANTFYSGTVKRSVSQIRREAELREAIEDDLDRHCSGQPEEESEVVRERLRRRIFSDPRFDWVHTPPGPFPKGRLPKRLADNPKLLLAAIVGVLALALFGVLAIVVPWQWALRIVGMAGGMALAAGLAAWAYLSKLAAQDPVIISRDERHIRDMVTFEDHIVQNQLTTLNPIKQPLWFRRRVLQVVLWVINLAARFQNTEGSLSGIPTIHFARWVVVDQGRRLIFFSNFDGSWESYLGDFVDKAHQGLTAIWSNCVGFPKTVGLTKGGASDEQRFKALARDSQIHTHVWYSAYKSLTVANINDNTRLRLGLYGEMTREQAKAWLRMGEARLPEDDDRKAVATPDINHQDVQGLVARSYSGLEHAFYVPVILPEKDNDPVILPENERTPSSAWLTDLIPRLTRAALSNKEVTANALARNLAFTNRGLARLGLDDAGVVGFSREFREGMATAHRQRLLGDVGDADPTKWKWGGPKNEAIDAMLFLFASDSDRLTQLLDEERQHAKAHGVTLGEPLDTVWLPEQKEHFGFHDGIAQPRVAGLGRAGAAASSSADVPAGEALLGYRNAYDVIPLSPTVPETALSAKYLALTPEDDAGLAEPRDFGRNGSYVVFRQLQQQVQEFWQDMDAKAAGDRALRKRLAAKMVGRWPNGAPLAVFDEEPATYDATQGEKLFYRDDLEGDSCPVGAHIRRTNPRDGLRPDTRESLKVSGRHRLLRRGRAYGPPLVKSFDPDEILRATDTAKGERGLHFICFNTDIARQFEFVQNAWMNSTKFDGLYSDPDPIAARQHRSPTGGHAGHNFTVQHCPVRQRVGNVKSFVKTVGGAYLFMPGFNALYFLSALGEKRAAD